MSIINDTKIKLAFDRANYYLLIYDKDNPGKEPQWVYIQKQDAVNLMTRFDVLPEII